MPEDAFEQWEAWQNEQEKGERWYRHTDLRESRLFSWFSVLGVCRTYSDAWTSDHASRRWYLLKRLDEGLNTPLRYPPAWNETLQAYKLGAANDNDMLERKSDLAKQTSRMRYSLEEAMNRGNTFTTSDFAELFEHPVLRPMLGALVFTTEDGVLGYPINKGKALRGADGSEVTSGETSVRVAQAPARSLCK